MNDDGSPRPTYSADTPLTAPGDDRFGRWPFAERIAHVLRERRDPGSLVVGLYGAWGEGKTTTLNFIEHALRDADDIVVVRFNPWRFGDETTLIRSFFETLAAAVGRKLTTRREDFATAASEYASALSFGALGATVDAKKLAEAVASVSLEDLRERLERSLRDAQVRVVVRVDDIDRLDKDEVQAVFRLVKLSADFEHVSYVLAFDPDVVAAALQERYGTGQKRAGLDFLDKIVTVPLQLPPARPQTLWVLCVEAVNEALTLSESEISDEGRRFSNAFQAGLLPAIRTPRVVQRYGNAVRFALPILAGEVDVTDQLLVEGLRIVYPALYEHVRTHPNVYLRSGVTDVFGSRDPGEARKRKRREVNEILASTVPAYIEPATALIGHLFPQATGGQPVPTARKDRRISSDWYADRYFTYSIPQDSIADRALAEVVTLAEGGDLDACTGRLRALQTPTAQRRLAEMLSLIAQDVPPSAASTLARAIARVSTGFTTDDWGFMQLAAQDRAATAVSYIIERVSDPTERQQIVEAVAAESPSLTFSLDVHGWTVPNDDGEGILDAEGGRQILSLIAERIAETAQTLPLYLADPRTANRFHLAWAEGVGRGPVAAYLAGRLHRDPAEVVPLLHSILPLVRGSDSPTPTAAISHARSTTEWQPTWTPSL